MFTTQSQQPVPTPAAQGQAPRTASAPVGQPSLQSLFQALADSGNIQMRAWQTLQRHMLEAQSEILKDCLSLVQARLKTVQQAPSPATRAAGQPEHVPEKVVIE